MEKTVKSNPSTVFEKIGMDFGGSNSMMSQFTSTDVFLKQLDNEDLVHFSI